MSCEIWKSAPNLKKRGNMWHAKLVISDIDLKSENILSCDLGICWFRYLAFSLQTKARNHYRIFFNFSYLRMVFFNSRVRKRNFSVPLPSERTLDIRDSKNENQLETNQDKEGALTGPEDETRNTLYPAPAFTTFRTTLAKRNSTKSSEWIPLLPTESTDQKTGFPSPSAVVL